MEALFSLSVFAFFANYTDALLMQISKDNQNKYRSSSIKSPGVYLFPSIFDPTFNQGRLLFKTGRLFMIDQNDARHLIETKTIDVIVWCYYIV